MVKSLSTYLIVRGVLALIVGIVAVAWPGVTVYALVLLFGVYAFMDRVQAVRAFSGLRAGAANARILIALVDVAAGVAAIAYPNITAVALVVIVAIWAIAFAVLELFAAFGASETAGTGAWFVVAELVSIPFGFVLVGRPDVGAVSLAVIYGIFSLAFGTTEIVIEVQARRAAAAPYGFRPFDHRDVPWLATCRP
jgi:uncharacterized membrane protein HdeD (DUF308 family)